jgi:hypothetical protein
MFLNYIYIFVLSLVIVSFMTLSLYVSMPINIYHKILLIISIGIISYSISERITNFIILEFKFDK